MVALFKNPDQLCLCGCGKTKQEFCLSLMESSPTMVIDGAVAVWDAQQRALREMTAAQVRLPVTETRGEEPYATEVVVSTRPVDCTDCVEEQPDGA